MTITRAIGDDNDNHDVTESEIEMNQVESTPKRTNDKTQVHAIGTTTGNGNTVDPNILIELGLDEKK